MSSADIRGKFIWHELITTSPEGAAAFYGKLVPWKAQPTAMPSYSLWTMGGVGVGGLVAAQEDDSPQWLVYIATPDVDATVADATELGARVVKPPADVPDVGRFAVLDDPQGARFALFTPGEGSPEQPESRGEPGEFSWHELATTDPEEAADFYVELFGWERGATHDLGQMGTYQLIEHDGRQIGGIHRARPGTAPRWLSYLRVIDATESAEDAKAAGGRVLNGPMEVPDGSWIVMLQDPQGTSFAVHEPTMKAATLPVKARKPAARRPAEEKRVLAAEQPKPAAASESIVDDEHDEDEEQEETAQPRTRRAPARPRRVVRKQPAKRTVVRRVAKKKAARTKTHARPAAAKKRPAARGRPAARAAASRAARPARPARKAPAKRTPARVTRAPARPAAPSRRAAVKKATRGVRGRRR